MRMLQVIATIGLVSLRVGLHAALAGEPQFTGVTAAAGLAYVHGYRDSLIARDGWFDERRHTAGGVAAGDYDGDVWIDLYAVHGDIGPNLLLRNRGDGTFADETDPP